MKIERFVFGPFETNCYVVSFPLREGQKTGCLLIDPACSNDWERQQLLEYINSLSFTEKQGVDLSILATHGHLDHLWGAKWATEQWKTPVYMHDADIPMAEAMQQQYDLFGIRMKAESFPIENLQSSISNLQSTMSNFQLLETPGHTPGSICLYFPEEKVLFSGDTLFQMGYGRTDLPGGDYIQLIDSLERLFDLPSDVKVYPGHGNFTTIGAEKR